MTSISTNLRTKTSLREGLISPLEIDLPEVAETKEGVRFTPREDTWRIHDGGTSKTFNLVPLRQLCSDQHILSVKKVLLYLLNGQAMVSAYNFLVRYLWMCKFIVARSGRPHIESLTPEDCIAYRSTLAENEEYRLHQIRGVIKTWHTLGYPGIDNDVPRILAKLKLKKNKTGTAIRTRDPHKGPFNNEEYEDIINYIMDAFADGDIELDEMALCNLALAFGARPISFASMRLGDLAVETNDKGIDEYYLKLPKAKRKEGGRRTHFMKRKLTPEFGHILMALKNAVLMRFANIVQDGLNPDALPFFASDRADRNYITPSSDLLLKLKAAFTKGKNPPTCKRTGFESEPLRINAYRFRYTVGTRMAEEGRTLAEIAEALGQNALASAKVYMKHTEAARKRINDAVKGEISELVKYWTGEIISKNDEAKVGYTPANRIRLFSERIQGDVVGNCGKSSFCGGAIPIPCYKCRSFQPWLEADHEEVLIKLLTDRKRMMDNRVSEAVYTANDEIILRLIDLVKTIREMRSDTSPPKELPYV